MTDQNPGHTPSHAPPGSAAPYRQVARGVPVTHLHIWSVLRTLIAEGSLDIQDRPLRILDIGCGDGLLIDSLMLLAAADGAPSVEIHGFDIGEQGYNEDSQLAKTISFLSARHPDIDWASRIRMLSGNEPWNYPPGYFDAAVSNQVIEHVHDLDGLLDNITAAVRTDGASIHLFPLAQCIPEAHCLVPFAHWISSFDARANWIALMSRIGIGRYRQDRIVLGHADVRDHARKTAAYIQCWTHYRSFADIARHCRGRGLALSYHFTKDFFATKLRRMLHLPVARGYRRLDWFGLEWLSFATLRYLSSSTLVIRPLSYDIGARIAAEKADRTGRLAPNIRMAA